MSLKVSRFHLSNLAFYHVVACVVFLLNAQITLKPTPNKLKTPI